VIVIVMISDDEINEILKQVKWQIDQVEELAKIDGVDKKTIYILLGKCFGKIEVLKEYRNRL
jgi:endonuclease III